MTWVLIATLLAWLALGPWVLAAAVACLCVPRVRWWVQDRLGFSARRTTIAAAAAALVAGVVLVVPDGWLPVPPGPGALAAPSYLGRPATPRAVAAEPVPQHPHLAPNGVSAGHGDGWASDASPWPGPLGLQPEVDTAWFGLEECSDLSFDSHGRIVTVCRGRSATGVHVGVHVIDPETMRKQESLDLPSSGDSSAGESLCGDTPFYLDERDRVVLATGDRVVEALGTSDDAGDPDLTREQSWDLRPFVPDGDCVVALAPDWSGRIWWASRAGLVGTISQGGDVRAHDLGEGIHDSFAVDERGGAYVVTDRAVHRLAAGADGTPQATWRTAYDRGDEQKPGQLTRGSGTTPTILEGGVVAFADNADPAMQVVFVRADTGEEICRRAVFEDEAGATEASLASVGSGVVVTNQYGNRGRRGTMLGFATEPGIARVDVAGGDCTLRWTSDQIAPSSTPRVSWASGLVYAYTKRPTWTGVSAWYVTALDVESGRAMWSARTGTGALYDDGGASITVGPDATLWAGTVAGLVRVRDRD